MAVAAGLVAWGIVLLTPWLGASRLTLLLQLVVGASAAVLVAWALATVLRISEIATVTRLVKRVLGRLVPGRA